MKIESNDKIFIVELSDEIKAGSFCSGLKKLVVIAKDYQQASLKAIRYHEFNKETDRVLTSDGSLTSDALNKPLKVVGVQLISETVII